MTTALQNARGGDLQAFEQLVRQHQSEVLGLAMQLTGQHATALEVAQEAFVQLHTAIARITSPTHVRHWLLRAVSQLALEQPWQQADESDPLPTISDPGPEFTARVMAHVELRWSHRRADFVPAASRRPPQRRRRYMLRGTLAIASVAALVALWWWMNEQAGPAAATASPVATVDSPPANKPARPVDVARAAPVDSSRSPVQQNGFPQYTLIALPPRNDSLDPKAVAPVEAFHAALLAELRKLPGVVLLVPGVSAPPDATQPADYLLTLTSLESITLPNGGSAFRVTDHGGGTLSAGSTSTGRQWPVELRILPVGNSSAASFMSNVQIGTDNEALQQLAARQVGILRERVLPDAQVRQQLIARFRDASRATMERNRALEDLLGDQKDRAPGLTSIEIGALVAGASTLPADERAWLWRELRGATNADLIEPLLDSLRRDLDLDVRFEALATLAADYAAIPHVRSSIDAVSREDPSAVMRKAARRNLSGDADWRAYVLNTLKDATLPLPERLSPLLLVAHSASTSTELQAMKALTKDQEIVNALSSVVRDSWFDYTQVATIADALTLLANSGNPATPNLIVQVPQDPTRQSMPNVITPAIAQPSQISPAAMSWLQRNRNNPRARRMLDDIARGNADPRMGAMIEQMMQQRPPPRGP